MAKQRGSTEKLPRNIRRKGDGFELRMARKGYPSISKCFDTLEEAKREKIRIEFHIAEGKAPPNVKAKKFTVADAVDEYIKKHTDKKNNILLPKNKISDIRLIRADLGNVKVLRLSHTGLDEYIKAKLEEEVPPPKNKLQPNNHHPLYNGGLKRKRSPATVRKYYYALKTVLEWHSIKEHFYDLPPKLFEGQEPPPAWGKGRERRLENGEEKKLLSACDKMRTKQEEWKRLIQLALETAMRAQELLFIRWKDVHLDQRFINIPASIVKTRTSRQVPLSKKAIAILKAQQKTKKSGEDRVFWQWSGTSYLSHGFKRITTNATCIDLRFHDLRHEATSRLFERTSLTMMEIATITGHTDLKTLQRYTHLRPQIMADKLEKPFVIGIL
ncbi:MAG: site-specific integrase [Betaproteobacteria bacterium]|nr:site-specific integrase [Betaproteobacteria bacterium]